MNQLPVTCGLYFSLGHSTIVIAVNVAIAISSDVYDRIGGIGSVGGIVGSAVSGSFLFIIGVANSIILYRILRRRQRVARRRRLLENGGSLNATEENEVNKHETSGLMMRIIGPVTTFVNKPWKMYPVGVLFGFGFDTASSIALIAVTALAKKGADGESIAQGDIIILPFLFTSGMIIVDSADSVLMLYSYAGFTDRNKWALVKRSLRTPIEPSVVANQQEDQEIEHNNADTESGKPDMRPGASSLGGDTMLESSPANLHVSAQADAMSIKSVDNKSASAHEVAIQVPDSNELERTTLVKLNTMSNLSIVLTLISILVALSISLIVIMGLIGQECGPCQNAANAEDGGGLAGSWWRGWAKANDNSGFIGAAIVGGFVAVVSGWYAATWAVRRWKNMKPFNM